MDFVIKIIVSIVVTLAVGFLIINISNDLLLDQKENIENINVNNEDAKKIIEKENFSSDEIKYLVTDCYDRYIGITAKDVCYILKSENIIDLNSITGFPAYVNNTGGSSKTIYIKIDKDQIIIED